MQIAIHDFPVFLSAAILLNLTPGPDTLYILGRSLSQGRKSGMASVLGIASGTVGHTLLAAFGLSALLMESAIAFNAVKLLGAGYLIFLGIKTLTSKKERANPEVLVSPGGTGSNDSYWRIYRQGMITNLLNPKVALFFLALLPQFVDHTAKHTTLSFIALGFTFIFTGTVWSLFVALFAARMGGKIKRSRRAVRILEKTTGLVFVALGIRLAVAER